MASERRHYPGVRHSSRSLEVPEAAYATATPALERRAAAMVADHFDFIWRLLRRTGLGPTDADDAAQQVFMTAAQKIARIAPGSERTFLYGTALHVAANARRRNRRREAEAPVPETYPVAGEGPEARAELGRAWALLDELLLQLPAELGRVLVLAEVEQIEVKEIAAMEGIPVGTAASRLRRARERFQMLLAELGSRHPFRGTDGE